jgi:deoxyxylulose-5-phosphate synthase
MILPVLNIGLGDSFIQHGTREECLQQAELDFEGILRQVTRFLGLDLGEAHAVSSANTARHGRA